MSSRSRPILARRRRAAAWLWAPVTFIGLMACQSPRLVPESEWNRADLARHVVLANSAGAAVDPVLPAPCDEDGDRLTVDDRVLGSPKPVIDGLRAFLDERIKAALAAGTATPEARVLVYVHGGLNEVEGSCREALDHASFLRRHEPDTYPVFLTWPSGGLESYGDEITNVSEGSRHHNLVLKAGAPTRLVLDPLGGLTRAPGAAVRQSLGLLQDIRYDLLGADPSLAPILPEKRPDRYDASQGAGWASVTPDSNVIYDAGERQPGALSRLRSYTVVPALFPIRVGLTPFVDGYGETTWRNLKRRAFASVRLEPDRAGPAPRRAASPPGEVSPCREGVQTNHGPLPDGAFGAFAVELARLLVTPVPPRPGVKPGLRYGEVTRLDLVGHSMGGIVLGELLHEFPCLEVANLVYLGSAASLNHFDKTALPYLNSQAGQRTKVYLISLHPLNERNEDVSKALPLVPRGSLLYWIDTMYEPTSRGLDKTMGSWANIMVYKGLLPAEVQRGRMVFKAFGFDPDLPQKHGELDDVICRARARACAAGDIRYAYWSPDSWSARPLANDRLPCVELATGARRPAAACPVRAPEPLGNLARPVGPGVEQPEARP